MITSRVEQHLIPFIKAKCPKLGYRLNAVNCVKNHMHILITLSPSDLIADVAKNLKGASAHYINKELSLGDNLYWQRGYGVLSISKKDISRVTRYIREQKTHHQAGTLIDDLERYNAEG